MGSEQTNQALSIAAKKSMEATEYQKESLAEAPYAAGFLAGASHIQAQRDGEVAILREKVRELETEKAAQEQWKYLKYGPFEVEVSNHARVRRLDGKILNPTIHRTGYYQVMLKKYFEKYNATVKNVLVHRLVCLAFRETEPGKDHVNHINGNRLDNSIENLEWVTPQGNSDNAKARGSMSKGERHHNSKLTENHARKIVERYVAGESAASLAREYKVSYNAVNCLLNKKTWQHLWENNK